MYLIDSLRRTTQFHGRLPRLCFLIALHTVSASHREPIKTIYILALLPRLPDWQFAQVKRICEPVFRCTGKPHRYEYNFFFFRSVKCFLSLRLFMAYLRQYNWYRIAVATNMSKRHWPGPRNRAIKGVAESKHTLVQIAGIAIWPGLWKYGCQIPIRDNVEIVSLMRHIVRKKMKIKAKVLQYKTTLQFLKFLILKKA